jgi:hypothetical protein
VASGYSWKVVEKNPKLQISQLVIKNQEFRQEFFILKVNCQSKNIFLDKMVT